MRDAGGERPERGQLVRLPHRALVGQALADVGHERDRAGALVRGHVAQAHLDREFHPVLLHAREVETAPHRAHAWRAHVGVAVRDVGVAMPRGYQELHRLPDQLVARVAEHLLGLGVHLDDPARGVHDHHRLGGGLEERAGGRLAPPQRLFHLGAPGDVAREQRGAHDGPMGVADGGDADEQPDVSALRARLIDLDLLGPALGPHSRHRGRDLRGDAVEDLDRLPDHVARRRAQQALGPRVPGEDAAVLSEPDDRDLDGAHEGRQPRSRADFLSAAAPLEEHAEQDEQGRQGEDAERQEHLHAARLWAKTTRPSSPGAAVPHRGARAPEAATYRRTTR